MRFLKGYVGGMFCGISGSVRKAFRRKQNYKKSIISIVETYQVLLTPIEHEAFLGELYVFARV